MTTIHELAADLPWGFHDAWLADIRVDYLRGFVTMALALDWGDDAPELRDATLTLSGVAMLSILAPDAVDLENGMVVLDSSEGLPPEKEGLVWPAVPQGCFVHCFFVAPWNNYIVVYAKHATLTLGEFVKDLQKRERPAKATEG